MTECINCTMKNCLWSDWRFEKGRYPVRSCISSTHVPRFLSSKAACIWRPMALRTASDALIAASLVHTHTHTHIHTHTHTHYVKEIKKTQPTVDSRQARHL